MKTFSTLDIYLSSFLFLNGEEPDLTIKNNKVAFNFDANDNVYRLMAEFNTNPEIPCLDLITAIKTLRGKMLSAKESITGNGGRYGYNHR
ncbi:MAG: hypothetical protein NT010_11060 [Proteobacteria bacterium]|nr:hypothetical protein [Pseudomonadota bacterium]